MLHIFAVIDPETNERHYYTPSHEIIRVTEIVYPTGSIIDPTAQTFTVSNSRDVLLCAERQIVESVMRQESP